MPGTTATVRVADLRRDPEQALLETSLLGEVVWVRAGRQQILLVSGPEAAREVLLERSEELVKPPSQAIPVGRQAREREESRLAPPLLRRALSKGMGSDRAAETADVLVAAVEAETARWSEGRTVRLMPWLRPLVCRAVVQGAFASSLSGEELARLAAVVRWAGRTPRVRGRRPTLHGIARPFELARLSVVTRSLIANADLSRPSELSALLLEDGRASPLTAVEQRALASELLLGAIGPLVQDGGWALFRLARETEPTARLRAEWERGAERPYTEAFVREVTRLHPTNPLLTRVAVTDTSVGGVPVPAGSRAIVNVAALHRDAHVYPEPERFEPERWLGGRSPEHRFSYVAFGIGERRCLGETIATRALAALIEAVGRDWDLTFDAAGISAAGRRQLGEEARAVVIPSP
jgi:cytochrome P450